MRALLVLILLSGCASFGQPYEKAPGNEAHVYVRWSTPAEILKHCGPGKDACASLGDGHGSLSFIYAQEPKSFDDYPRVLNLGHELLHSLGAKHE